jgi:hypothetical protein
MKFNRVWLLGFLYMIYDLPTCPGQNVEQLGNKNWTFSESRFSHLDDDRNGWRQLMHQSEDGSRKTFN